MKRRKNNKKIVFIVLLLVVAGVVGYAALRTNLTINGQTTVAKNSWSVKFTTITQVKNDGTITSTPVVTGDTTFSFGVKLNTPGDEYKVKVKVENQGTIDAMVSGNPTLSGLSDMDDYLDYSVTYADGIAVEAGNLLAAGSEDEIIVTLKFKDNIDADDLADLATADVTKTMVFSMTYVQKDNTASERQRLVTLPNGRTKDNLEVGDEICVNGTTTECFNFIGYDGTNIKMLSKWNLKVGNIYNSSYTKTGEYTSSDTGYGLQSSDVKGWVSGASTFNGTVAFSGTNYWADGSSLRAKYGSAWDTNNIYDTDYSDATGTNYSIAYYVKKYRNTLETYGLTVQSARLLTYSEVTDSSIGCNGSNWSCPTTGFITNTSFWLGSARSNHYVWGVYSDGDFRNFDRVDDGNYGVRPVIVISKSDI